MSRSSPGSPATTPGPTNEGIMARKRSNKTPDASPFPPLAWDGYCWTGQTVLPFWRGFQARQGPYAGVSSKKPSDGTVRLFIAAESEGHPPTPEQAAAYRHLIDQEKAVGDVVLQAVFGAYPEMREE